MMYSNEEIAQHYDTVAQRIRAGAMDCPGEIPGPELFERLTVDDGSPGAEGIANLTSIVLKETAPVDDETHYPNDAAVAAQMAPVTRWRWLERAVALCEARAAEFRKTPGALDEPRNPIERVIIRHEMYMAGKDDIPAGRADWPQEQRVAQAIIDGVGHAVGMVTCAADAATCVAAIDALARIDGDANANRLIADALPDALNALHWANRLVSDVYRMTETLDRPRHLQMAASIEMDSIHMASAVTQGIDAAQKARERADAAQDVLLEAARAREAAAEEE